MPQKNELPALAVSLVLTAALLGGGGWWLKNNVFGTDVQLPGGNSPGTVNTGQNGGSRGDSSSAGNVAGADGTSGRSMLPGSPSATKQKGLEALAAGDYAGAQVEFTAALAESRNDPESLIYLNNAKIGSAASHVLALSVPAGATLNPALEMIRGVAQAQTDINEAGGISGVPLKVLIVDDQGDPDTAAAIANELVNNKDVLGVIGHYSSDVSLAASKVYEAGQLAMMSPTSTAVKISDAGDYIFRTAPSDRLATATLARYVRNTLKQSKAAVFYTSDSTYSNSVKSEFTTELLTSGGQVVIDFDITAAGFSAGRAVQSAKEAGAEVIMLALTTATADTALQIISVNQGELPMVGGDGLYNPKILDVGRANAEGLTVAVPWHILSHEQAPFVKDSRQLWGGDVSWRTAMAYDAATTFANAIAQGGQTRQGIVEALSATGFSAEGATDTVRFLPNGDRNQPSQLVQIVPGPRSGSGYDYAPVK
ncbi:MAG: ABC transporter substrate-binding protein [Cyanobacteria bacterium J06634_5]